MTQVQLKKIIRIDLTPKYEAARDSRIAFSIRSLVTIFETRSELKAERAKGDFGSHATDKYKELYAKLFGKSENDRSATKGIVGGLSKRDYKLIMDGGIHASKSVAFISKRIAAYYKAEYKALLTNLVDGIAAEVKVYKPTGIESGYSEHDLNFLITLKGGKQRSFTINTIIAGGQLVVLHNRTLTCFHKGVI